MPVGRTEGSNLLPDSPLTPHRTRPTGMLVRTAHRTDTVQFMEALEHESECDSRESQR